MNYTSITLGELLSSENETIKRNAVSILKQLQKSPKKCEHSFIDVDNTIYGKEMCRFCGKTQKK